LSGFGIDLLKKKKTTNQKATTKAAVFRDREDILY